MIYRYLKAEDAMSNLLEVYYEPFSSFYSDGTAMAPANTATRDSNKNIYPERKYISEKQDKLRILQKSNFFYILHFLHPTKKKLKSYDEHIKNLKEFCGILLQQYGNGFFLSAFLVSERGIKKTVEKSSFFLFHGHVTSYSGCFPLGNLFYVSF